MTTENTGVFEYTLNGHQVDGMVTKKYLEEMAARLAERLAQDIEQSKTREEHIRTTARANEAAELLVVIRSSAVN
jgi:hypothetical protein